VRWGNRW